MFNTVKKYLGYLCVAAVTVVSFCSNARAEDLIPDMPVDFAALATEGMSTVGVVFGAIAGIVVVIALVKMGFRYLASSFQGRV